MTVSNLLNKYKYTWGIVHCRETNEILLLNRQKAPWMGRWNGFGGKLEEDEDPLQGIIREAKEETGLEALDFEPHGVMEWEIDGEDKGGMYVFVAEVKLDVVESYSTPTQYCHEGILDWKNLEWVMHDENTGVVDNVKIMLEYLFDAPSTAVFRAIYRKGTLQKVEYRPKT